MSDEAQNVQQTSQSQADSQVDASVTNAPTSDNEALTSDADGVGAGHSVNGDYDLDEPVLGVEADAPDALDEIALREEEAESQGEAPSDAMFEEDQPIAADIPGEGVHMIDDGATNFMAERAAGIDETDVQYIAAEAAEEALAESVANQGSALPAETEVFVEVTTPADEALADVPPADLAAANLTAENLTAVDLTTEGTVDTVLGVAADKEALADVAPGGVDDAIADAVADSQSYTAADNATLDEADESLDLALADEVGEATRIDDDVMSSVDVALAESPVDESPVIESPVVELPLDAPSLDEPDSASAANVPVEAQSVGGQETDEAESSLLGAITGAVSDIASAASDAAGTVLDSAAEAASSTSALASDAASTAAGLAGSATGRVVDAASNLAENLTGAASDAVENAAESTQAVAQTAGERVESTMEAVVGSDESFQQVDSSSEESAQSEAEQVATAEQAAEAAGTQIAAVEDDAATSAASPEVEPVTVEVATEAEATREANVPEAAVAKTSAEDNTEAQPGESTGADATPTAEAEFAASDAPSPDETLQAEVEPGAVADMVAQAGVVSQGDKAVMDEVVAEGMADDQPPARLPDEDVPEENIKEVLSEDDERQKVRTLAVGEEVHGVVKRLTDFGAFIDIGVGRDGLVHISELALGRVDKVADVLTKGQEVTMWIKKLDRKRNRISLTLVDPDRKTIRDLKEDEIVEGTVTRILPYGAFIDIGVGRDALLHVREMSNRYVEKPEDVVSMGETLEARIISLSRRRKRVDLSLKGLRDEPEAEEPQGGGASQARAQAEPEPEVPEPEEIEVLSPMELAFKRAMEADGDDVDVPDKRSGGSKSKRRRGKQSRAIQDEIVSRTLEGREQN